LAQALALDALEGNPSLLDGLQDGGGGLDGLMLQAIAGILNAAHADLAYPYSVEEVLALIEAAFTTGEFEPVKDMFQAANEAGCPLPTGDIESALMSVPTEANLTPTPLDTPTEAPTSEQPTETQLPVEPTATVEAPAEIPTEAPSVAPTEDPTEPPEPTPDPEPPPTAEG
jgi:hypothetical protein